MNSWGWVVVLIVLVLKSGVLVSACAPDAPSPSGQKSLVAAAEGLPMGDEWRQDFTFADMDGDSELDLITAPPRKSKEPWPHIFLRQQNGWTSVSCPGVERNGFPQQEYGYGGVAVADFTGDGKAEIAIAMHETGLRILTNTGTGPCGPWEEQQGVPDPVRTFRSRAIVSVDMNRDGRADLLLLSEAPPMDASDMTPGLAILWNETSGWRLQTITGSDGLFGDDIAVGEVNGDGVPDIATGSLGDSRPDFLWLSDGNGGWHTASAEGLPSNMIAWSVQLVDFDNDGKDELLLGVGGAPMYKNGGPRVYRWDGTRWQSLSQGLPQVFWVSGVTAVDFDGDGRKEIVAAGMYTGTVKVHSQQSDGTWVEQQEIKEEKLAKVRNYKVRSFRTNTGRQDVIVANYAGENSGTITAWSWR
jgi:hypothetical protein